MNSMESLTNWVFMIGLFDKLGFYISSDVI